MRRYACRLLRRLQQRTTPQTIGEPTSEAPSESETAQATEPTGAQELTFVLNNEPDSLDPSYTNNSFASPFLTNLFEGLVTYDENGELAPETLKPGSPTMT